MLHTIFVPFVFEPIALPHYLGILKKISDPPPAMVVAGFFMNLPFLVGIQLAERSESRDGLPSYACFAAPALPFLQSFISRCNYR